jgi:hypothetical protein
VRVRKQLLATMTTVLNIKQSSRERERREMREIGEGRNREEMGSRGKGGMKKERNMEGGEG